MRKIETSAFDIAQRFIGVKEIPGQEDDPRVLAMLRLDAEWPEGDEVPWCSAFVNYVCWLLRLPRSKSLRARSWLSVGAATEEPEVGFDVAILKRGGPDQPGPEVIKAQGHVGFYAGEAGEGVLVLGGNQGDAVNIKLFPWNRVLGIRSLR